TPWRARLARIDLPDELRHDCLEFDAGAGQSLLVAGSGRSGRTQSVTRLVLALAGQLGPAELTVHVVDPVGPLARAAAPLPHAGTGLTTDGLALVPRLLERLEQDCSPPVSAGRSLLVIDGWDRLLAALPDG